MEENKIRENQEDLEAIKELIKDITNRRDIDIKILDSDGNITDFSDEIDDDDDVEDYKIEHDSREITFLEMAMLNSYLHASYRGQHKEFKVSSYGNVDNVGRIKFGGGFDITSTFWFNGVFEDIQDNEFIFQTKLHVVNNNELSIIFNMTSKKGVTPSDFDKIFKKILTISFNHSEYRGKVIKVKLREGRFKGIEIIDIKQSENELVLTEVQLKFIQHFVDRVKRGNNARYLLNGEPGTGKTESIREIARKLIPHATFVIPDFDTSEDLTAILEACEIFENGVIIMDDIDLYLGSRDNGSYTRLLGQFLSFFDGVKKRKISLLASTNDKGLVDKAAERPGRFNFTLDYSFLNEDQIVKVCNIHLPEKWHLEEVYETLTGNINGKKVNITGAFIANLAENLKEMSEDDPNWSLDDTISLIKESYRGFYSSQIDKNKNTMGFIN